MSMICNLVGVEQTRLNELIASPGEVLDFILPEDGPEPEPRLDLDKTWHGLHYLLNGDPWEGEEPLCLAILGGTPIGEDTGYGPPRYLMPSEVASVSAALDEVAIDDLEARFDPTAMNDAQVYPHGWTGNESSWVLGAFSKLVDFYAKAAAKDMAVLLCLS